MIQSQNVGALCDNTSSHTMKPSPVPLTESLFLGNTPSFFGKHLPLFCQLILHLERAKHAQKEQGQVPVSQILALYVTNFQHFPFILLLRPARRPDVRWAHGTENSWRSSCQSLRRTSQSWAHHHAHRRYRNAARDEPHDQPSQRT